MAFAHPAQAHTQYPSSASKGVRTMAYQRRLTVPSLPPEVSASAASQAVADRARSVVGARYAWGGTDPRRGFDCSGLTRYALGDAASNLPRTSYALYSSVQKVNSLRPGDLVFFGWGSASHVGIYVGNRRVVHASTYSTGVREDSLDTLIPALGLRGIGRVI